MRNCQMDARRVAGALLIALLAGVPVSAAVRNPEVALLAGRVRGIAGEGFSAFEGIPYAAPPLGPLRWRPPQSVARWTGVRDAAQFGPDCSQTPFPNDAAPSTVSFSEDCLYINVWKPTGHLKSLAVMVWIYGGGFVNGGSSPAVYDGSAFAKDGVVLVSFNYRVGNFGYFAHPALSAEHPSEVKGNYGLMDQIAALQWVHANVAAFGGDPANVTVFGESAGGMSIHYLMSSPLAVGLFNKAIVESGGGRAGLFGVKPLTGAKDSAEAIGLKLAHGFGIEGSDSAALDKLRALPADSLAKGLHMGTLGSYGAYVGGPVHDGKLIIGDPATLYAEGAGMHIPLIVGATNADIGFAPGTTLEALFERFGVDASRARLAFDPDGTASVGQVGAAIGGSQFMIEPARHIARVLSARGQPVYEYRFSYVAEALRAMTRGALHASELPYVFDTGSAALGPKTTEADRNAAKVIHAYWVAFARSGKPRVAGQPAWPAYQTSSDEILDFTNAGPIAGVDPWQARLDLVAHGR
jgi:para-nitrobenzyl esterase